MTNPRSEIRNQKSTIVVGTRGSALAQWQTNHIIAALKKIDPGLQVEIRIIKTSGDQDQTRSLAELGGLGVFTKEIENALLAHQIDLAVHSLKDLPTETAAGLTIAAIPQREDPRDCIVSRHGVGLMQLPHGARIGTSSARRSAQVLALRPDAQIVPLRGNVDTRLRKAQTQDYDAVVLAAAGITRLGRASEITEYLPLDKFLPDPGQGALAVEIRADDAELAALVEQLNDAPTRAAVTAERAFLQALGGGCRMPIGTFAETLREPGQMILHALIASDDGSKISRGEISGEAVNAEKLGAELAARLRNPQHAPQVTPLHGRRILITRAKQQAPALGEKIRALGGEPIEFPTIDFAPVQDFHELDNAFAHINQFDWVVFTSANGVHFVAERLRALGKDPLVFASNKIAAIGPATASALRDLGVRVDFVPTKFLGEQIAIELPIANEQRALLLRADIASDVLQRGLTARGVAVTDIDVYRTVMPPASSVDFQKIDAITFTSSSTVRNFIALLDGAPVALLHTKIFCIGPVTANTARELGLRVDAVATEHTIDGLLDAMVRYYRTRTNADER